MPTHEESDEFWRYWGRLTPQEQAAFKAAIPKFVHDLRTGTFRKGLRVKRLRRNQDEWEMTWAPDGRAVFEYGPSLRQGDPHIIWKRIGSHDILDES